MIWFNNIQLDWIEQAIATPHRVEKDAINPKLTHYLFKVAEFGNRVLRVLVNHTVEPMRIISVFFDRTMRNKL